MKFVIKIPIFFIFFISFSSTAFSQSVGELKETYCGSGFSKFFVPDNLFGCTMTEACKAHDICYGRCDKEGDLYNSKYCAQSELSKERTRNKKQCDENLKKVIQKVNGNSKVCNVIGGVYKFAVKMVGQGPFNGRKLPQLYLDVIESSSTPDEAIIKLEAIDQLTQRNLIDPTEIFLNSGVLTMPTLSPVEQPLSTDHNTILIPHNFTREESLQFNSIQAR